MFLFSPARVVKHVEMDKMLRKYYLSNGAKLVTDQRQLQICYIKA